MSDTATPARACGGTLTLLRATPRRAAALLVALLLGAVLALTGASAAHADSVGLTPGTGASAPTTSTSACGSASTSTDSVGVLPIDRWSNSMGFHTRLHAMSPSDMARSVTRNGVESTLFDFGNMFYRIATGMVEFASQFCVMDSLGHDSDELVAAIGKPLLFGPVPILFFALAGALLTFIWSVVRRRAGSSAELMRRLGVGVFLIVMVAGASATTSTAFGFLSPGWITTTAANALSSSAGAPEAACSAASSSAGCMLNGAEDGPAGHDELGCAPYVKSLHDAYTGSQAVNSGTTAVPLMMSALWEETGLKMWERAQFGGSTIGTYGSDDKPYTYGDLMYCRWLEDNAGVARTTADVNASGGTTSFSNNMQWVMMEAGDGSVPTADIPSTDTENAMAWRVPGDNKTEDRQLIGWAACAAPRSASNASLGLALVHYKSGDRASATTSDLNTLCKKFFTDPDDDASSATGTFDWDDSDDDISENDTSAQAKDFMLVSHGVKIASGMADAGTFLVSAFLVMLVFLGLSLVVIVAKLMALFFGISLLFALLHELFVGNGGTARSFKQMISSTVLAWGTSLILTIISTFTAALVGVGGQVMPGGYGGVMSTMWTGFAPLAAILILHHLIKKTGAPSPFQAKNAMSYGKMAAGGALAGAAAVGVEKIGSRIGNAGKRWAKGRVADRLEGSRTGSALQKMGALPASSRGKGTTSGAGASTGSDGKKTTSGSGEGTEATKAGLGATLAETGRGMGASAKSAASKVASSKTAGVGLKAAGAIGGAVAGSRAGQAIGGLGRRATARVSAGTVKHGKAIANSKIAAGAAKPFRAVAATTKKVADKVPGQFTEEKNAIAGKSVRQASKATGYGLAMAVGTGLAGPVGAVAVGGAIVARRQYKAAQQRILSRQNPTEGQAPAGGAPQGSPAGASRPARASKKPARKPAGV